MMANDCGMIASLVNGMEKQIACGIMMLNPAKKIWNTLKNTYGYEKNISRIAEIYEQIFTLQ